MSFEEAHGTPLSVAGRGKQSFSAQSGVKLAHYQLTYFNCPSSGRMISVSSADVNNAGLSTSTTSTVGSKPRPFQLEVIGKTASTFVQNPPFTTPVSSKHLLAAGAEQSPQPPQPVTPRPSHQSRTHNLAPASTIKSLYSSIAEHHIS